MTPESKDTLLSFIEKPKTLVEISAHMNMSYAATQGAVKRMRFDGLITTSDKRKIDGLFYNTYMATSQRERDARQSSKEAVVTPSASFMNDPIMAGLYSSRSIT